MLVQHGNALVKTGRKNNISWPRIKNESLKLNGHDVLLKHSQNMFTYMDQQVLHKFEVISEKVRCTNY